MLLKDKEVVMVVYAYEMFEIGKCSHPWIYGVYQDHSEGFQKMEEMRNSCEYGHLTWQNNLVELK